MLCTEAKGFAPRFATCRSMVKHKRDKDKPFSLMHTTGNLFCIVFAPVEPTATVPFEDTSVDI